MKILCHSKYEQETSEQEYNFIQQQIAYYNSPNQSFQCSYSSRMKMIGSIPNPNVQRQLSQQYKDIAEQSRLKMFNLYLKTADEEKRRSKKNYEAEEKKMWTDRRAVSGNEPIPLAMIDLIEQRCKKISDRIEYIYQYKAQSTGTPFYS